MSPAFAFIAVILLIAQLWLPKRLGFLPLIVAGFHLGNGEILGDFTIARLLILLGLIRALFGGLFSSCRKCPLDALVILFALVVTLSAFGHQATISSPWNLRLGMAFNFVGTYFYGRAYLPDVESLKRLAHVLPIVMLPFATAMLLEHLSGQNYYYLLGAARPTAVVRDGKVRAQGPFRHAILAGCAGATSLSLAYLIWRRKRSIRAVVGFGTCLTAILTCSSSGPLAAVGITVAAASLWRWRDRMHLVRRGLVCLGAAYWVIKGQGPWYMMASIDLVGGSTGWHRAKLMDQGFVYLDEWWLFGTDYTRHWMASGVSWSTDHVDITNYYLHLGVIAGLPATLALVAILYYCFLLLGRKMRELREVGHDNEIVLWCAGAALAGHAVSFVSISYFDQMYILFYALVGAIPGLAHDRSHEVEVAEEIDPQDNADSVPAEEAGWATS